MVRGTAVDKRISVIGQYTVVIDRINMYKPYLIIRASVINTVNLIYL